MPKQLSTYYTTGAHLFKKFAREKMGKKKLKRDKSMHYPTNQKRVKSRSRLLYFLIDEIYQELLRYVSISIKHL